MGHAHWKRIREWMQTRQIRWNHLVIGERICMRICESYDTTTTLYTVARKHANGAVPLGWIIADQIMMIIHNIVHIEPDGSVQTLSICVFWCSLKFNKYNSKMEIHTREWNFLPRFFRTNKICANLRITVVNMHLQIWSDYSEAFR